MSNGVHHQDRAILDVKIVVLAQSLCVCGGIGEEQVGEALLSKPQRFPQGERHQSREAGIAFPDLGDE